METLLQIAYALAIGFGFVLLTLGFITATTLRWVWNSKFCWFLAFLISVAAFPLSGGVSLVGFVVVMALRFFLIGKMMDARH